MALQNRGKPLQFIYLALAFGGLMWVVSLLADWRL